MSSGRRRERLVAGPEAIGERLDRFLATVLPGVSRKAVKRALDGGQVFVESRTVRRAGYLLRGGEEIRLTLDPEAPCSPPPPMVILYRDEHLLGIAKPPGLPSHPTVAGRANALDLVAALVPGPARPILLHRLDADTSGVLLFALSAGANRSLAAQFQAREVKKCYLALVAGCPPASFMVDNHLRPGVRGRTVAVPSGGQTARTLFAVRKAGAGWALVEANPHTGRTHQIRAHLAGLEFPILGDLLYGGPGTVAIRGVPTAIGRHLLHAASLEFQHPETGRTLRIEAPLPDDFAYILAGLSEA